MERRLLNRRHSTATIVLAGALLALAAAAGIAFVSSAAGSDSAVGQPPPEVAEAGDAWPAQNYDLANSRATTSTAISAANVGTLKKKWSFAIPGTGAFGNFATTPIVLDGVVYFQDLNSNVYAVDQQTGKLKWKRAFRSPSIGPNGVSLGYGRLYGATSNTAFALDPGNGAVIWKHKLSNTLTIGIDMAPQVYDNKLLISTVPGGDASTSTDPAPQASSMHSTRRVARPFGRSTPSPRARTGSSEAAAGSGIRRP